MDILTIILLGLILLLGLALVVVLLRQGGTRDADQMRQQLSLALSLQEVLSNKQARGAFGEVQLNDLVQSALPPQAYEFQCTLSTGSRADCLLRLPNPPGSIAIDAKFPLESYSALR